MSTHHEIAEKCFDESICANKIYYLATMAFDAECFQHDLSEDLEHSDKILDLLEIDESIETDDLESIQEHLVRSNKLGYLVRFSTPAPIKFYGRGNYMQSWGYAAFEWFYGETFEDCFNQALKWKEEFIKAEREEAAKEQQ